MNDLSKAIAAYREKFGEGPPILRIPDNEAIAMIEKSIKTGKKITDTADNNIPDESYL